MRIFAHQDESDVAVLGPDVPAPQTLARIVRTGELRRLIRPGDVRLRGDFNLDNALCAAAVCLERGIDLEAVRAALREFAGLPHRLEHVATVGGVEYVNDSKATNPGAAAAAMEAMGAGVHAILGGSLKGGEFSELATDVRAFCRACYLIGEAADRLAEALAESGVELVRCGDLERAVHEAADRARPGEFVLLAPACASFDQYRDFEERGEQFKQLVRMLAVERG
jgi:UDP-N-acetylmuramoylalanine--D-glutamate ligase